MPTIRDGGTFFYSPRKCNWAEVPQVYLGFILWGAMGPSQVAIGLFGVQMWDPLESFSLLKEEESAHQCCWSKEAVLKATPVIAAYRVVSLPLHGLLAGLLASIPCQVTQEKRTENSMFGSGVSVIVLGVVAFPRQSLVHWQHTPFLTRKLVIAAISTIDYQLFTKNFQVQCYT